MTDMAFERFRADLYDKHSLAASMSPEEFERRAQTLWGYRKRGIFNHADLGPIDIGQMPREELEQVFIQQHEYYEARIKNLRAGLDALGGSAHEIVPYRPSARIPLWVIVVSMFCLGMLVQKCIQFATT